MTGGRTEVRVAIIGAGFGGLGVALKLLAAGHRHVTIYEREPDLGGTWFLNTYPGAACDAPSHLYSYSFAQNADWSRRFAPGPEIHAYLRRCVTDGGLDAHLRLGTEVVGARWTGREWAIELADGSCDVADVIVPALGQLTVPSIPDLPGLNEFGGPAFHSAQWRHDVDLTGKRVGVVGTGASAIQIVPAIAPHTAHVTVFQRSAPYVFKKGDVGYSTRLNRRYQWSPLLKKAARSAIWSYFELVTAGFSRWPASLEILRHLHQRILRKEIADPVLREQLRPPYRPGCKRILISDDYYPTLCRPDVTLESAALHRVTETGIVTESGSHELDVIVFGTGFATEQFATTMSIVGRGGSSLTEVWKQRAAAFLGMSVPDFPNMFLVYGPNTNLGSGSIVYMLESQANHIVSAVDRLSAHGSPATVEVRDQSYRKFLGDLAARQPHTVWQGCPSWYRDADGQDTHNWPWLMSTYRRRTRRIRDADYLITGIGAATEPVISP